MKEKRYKEFLEDDERSILNFFCDCFIYGDKKHFQINEVCKFITLNIPPLRLRVRLVGLEERGFIESLKVGKFNNYHRVFRINLDPESPGFLYYVARKNNKVNGKTPVEDLDVLGTE